MKNSETMTDAVECFRNWDQVRVWEGAWNAAAGSNFMLRTEWLESWWEAYQQRSDRLAIASFPIGPNSERGFLPGFITRGMLGRTFRWLGSGVACSDDMRLLGSATEQSGWGKLAAGWLSSEKFRAEYGRLDAIELEGYLGDEGSVRELTRGLQAAGWSLEERPIGGAWRVRLPATPEDYVNLLHKSRRRKVNKAKRLLNEGKVRFEAIWEWSRIDELWSEFVRLHQKRREALGQSGCFSDPRFGIFLRHATERMAQNQQCWMGTLWAGEEPIGINLNFQSGDSTGMYQSGMETDRTELEPGHLLNYCSIGTAIERGVEWFDFLRGDEPYKEGWGAERRVLYRSRLFAPHLLARVRQSALAAGRELRNWSSGWFGSAGPAIPGASCETAAE
jgi:CelD/BcsL family acetyltransferase involved in cellulose biosynthesis